MKTIIFKLLPFVLLTGCAVGPNFKSPEVYLPQGYIIDSIIRDSSARMIQPQWWHSFGDATLNQMIDSALVNNRNLAIALTNIEQARLKARSARADLLPTIGLDLNAALNYTYNTKVTQQYTGALTIAWDIDLFGKIRRMAEAAQNEYLSTRYGHQATQLALVAQVASTYFDLLQYDRNLAIARATYVSRAQSAAMIDSMFRYGASSEVDRQQAFASAATAQVASQQYLRAREQTALALNLLLGQNPTVIRETNFSDTLLNVEIPVGLPSSLLERRPDVMKAYYGVAAANANIGVAVANRLPSISITGQGGLLATFERDVTSGRPIGWGAVGSIIAPLLNWGNNKRAVDIARQQTLGATLIYEQTVLTALNEVEQALIAVKTYKGELEAARQVLVASQQAQILTRELYAAGMINYLNLQDADRTLFAAQGDYWQTMQNCLAAYVSLYQALGGGWTLE